jgi:hypothetical protein
MRSESRVAVERLHGTYMVPSDHPAPASVRARLDQIAVEHLGSLCGQLLGERLDGDDPCVWLVRRIDADVTVDLAAGAENRAARAWARDIASAIARAIDRGPDGTNVLRFESRTHYVAQFAFDLAEGQAWSKWYYRSFETMRSLPTHTALREVLVGEGERADEVLLLLAAKGRLERALGVLTKGDAARVYDACFAACPSGAGPERWLELLLTAWPETPLCASGGLFLASAHNALRLHVAVRAGSLGAPMDGGLRLVTEHLLGFAEITRRLPDPHRLVDLLVAGELGGAGALVGDAGVKEWLDSLAFVHRVAAGDAGQIRRVARVVAESPAAHRKALLHSAVGERRAPPAVLPQLANAQATGAPQAPLQGGLDGRAGTQTFSTSFGGIFLLLPAMIDLGVAHLVDSAEYEAPAGKDAAAALRLLLALKCLGRARAPEAVHDAAIHLAVGLDESPNLLELRGLGDGESGDADHAPVRGLIDALARRGPGSWAAGRHLAAELVAIEPLGQQLLLLRDLAEDAWLFVSTGGDEGADLACELERGLELVRESFGSIPELLLLERDLGRKVDAGSLAGTAECILATDGGVLEALPDEAQGALAGFRAGARRAGAELGYFTLCDLTPPLLDGIRFDVTWSLVARAVLKSFARRLLGFHRSSPEYLYQNFLAGPSIVTAARGAIEVLLPRCPLDVVLRMTGVDGTTYRVPWLGDAEVTLRLRGH